MVAGIYASRTAVSEGTSREEIRKTLKRYGATSCGFFEEATRGTVVFAMRGIRVKYVLPLPPKSHFDRSPTGRARKERASEAEWEQACRQRWRALALVIKAKLEAVESGVVSFEEEFLAQRILGTGETVMEQIRGQLSVDTKQPILLALNPGA